MTLKIELSDAVLQAAWDAWTDYPANLSTPRAHMALQATIIAALEAMVEEGTARTATGYPLAADRDIWIADSDLEPRASSDFPAIIIRLGGKP